MHTAALVSLATSVPPHTFLQKDVLAAAWDIFGSRFPDFERFASIFTNTGIVKRHGVKPLTPPRSSATSRATGSNSVLGSQQS
jgi:alkylresorcinol/alkylpyrone synthase